MVLPRRHENRNVICRRVGRQQRVDDAGHDLLSTRHVRIDRDHYLVARYDRLRERRELQRVLQRCPGSRSDVSDWLARHLRAVGYQSACRQFQFEC